MITLQDIYDHSEYGPKLAFVDAIAATAHGACGQTRADGTTQYIEHPRMAARLLLEQCQFEELTWEVLELVCATLLHDVVEDTKITKENLVRLLNRGVSVSAAMRIVSLVMRVTKPQGKMTEAQEDRYYLDINQNLGAKRIKAADRCANLKDSIEQVEAGQNVDRWERYLHKTVADILPMYKGDLELVIQFQALSTLVIELLSAIGQHRVRENTKRVVPCNIRCSVIHPDYRSNYLECSLNAEHVGHSPHIAHENHDLNKQKIAEWS